MLYVKIQVNAFADYFLFSKSDWIQMILVIYSFISIIEADPPLEFEPTAISYQLNKVTFKLPHPTFPGFICSHDD